jgi:superfamily I DNA and/or RNA helicase
MQLSQPIQGSHPGDSGQSLLEYLLQAHAVVPPELGVFLGVTRRMHPDICSFISGCVYEGRLQFNTKAEFVVRLEANIDPKKLGGSSRFSASSEQSSVVVDSRRVPLEAVQAVHLHLSSK